MGGRGKRVLFAAWSVLLGGGTFLTGRAATIRRPRWRGQRSTSGILINATSL
jgi:hypothetical protein